MSKKSKTCLKIEKLDTRCVSILAKSWIIYSRYIFRIYRISAVFNLDNGTEVKTPLDLMMPDIYAAYDLLYNSALLDPITNWRVYLGGRLYFVDIDGIWPADSGIYLFEPFKMKITICRLYFYYVI
jgi:hypothetical protein